MLLLLVSFTSSNSGVAMFALTDDLSLHLLIYLFTVNGLKEEVEGQTYLVKLVIFH